jgi:hypothetical protein
MIGKKAGMDRIALGLAALLLCFGSVGAAGEDTKVVLITSAEARLPAPPMTALTKRAGVTRGPQINALSPKPDAKGVSSPFRFQVKFTARSGAKIDSESVHVVYLKQPLVELTDRLKQYINADGIDVAAAEAPPGTHSIKIDVKDSEGRAGSTTLTFNVAP